MNHCIKLFIVLLASLFFLGCSSERERLESICSDIRTASKMTDNCEKMADYLSPRTEEYQRILARLNENEPDESKRKEYIDIVSGCLRGYLEISTGACRENKSVLSALPRDVK